MTLIYSIVEQCTSAWGRSTHTRLIDPDINDALQIVTGCMRPRPADNLPVLADIQPAELRRKGAILPLARPAIGPGHLFQVSLVDKGEMHRISNQGTPICTYRTTTHQFI